MKALLLLAGIILFTWLGYAFFPGHTYLQSDTQIYLPILERLDSPGFLSRDSVAARPHVAFTIYDEVALFLHRVCHLEFETALLGQMLLYRALGFLGIYLIALSTGVGRLYSFFASAAFHLGAALLGPAVLLVEYEPVPRGFAVGLLYLALGCLAHNRPLSAGIAASLALLYHPPTTAPFWLLFFVVYFADREFRKQAKPAWVTLIITILLLGNMAQLQPGAVEAQRLFGRIDPQMIDVQKFRTKYIWVSMWGVKDIWHYSFLAICGLWATVRIWARLNGAMRWFFVGLPLVGLLSMGVSYLLLEKASWTLIPEFQPARALVFTVAIASLACSLAGILAAQSGKLREAFLWFVVVFAIPISTRILDLTQIATATDLTRAIIWLSLAGLTVVLLRATQNTKWQAAVLIPPVLAVFLLPTAARVENFKHLDKRPVEELARWASAETWGSSLFLFPDASHDLYPGIFRARSRRALYVDWKSGGQVNYFKTFAEEWWSRWQHTMEPAFTPGRLQKLLPLPIDYYVLKRENQLSSVQPVYQNSQFLVYDAQDLRNASTSLRKGTED